MSLPLGIFQANETFAFVGNVTHYARVWLNISAELRTFLEEGKLHNHLAWLQQVQYSTSRQQCTAQQQVSVLRMQCFKKHIAGGQVICHITCAYSIASFHKETLTFCDYLRYPLCETICFDIMLKLMQIAYSHLMVISVCYIESC